jgi:hypothetical protein
MDANPVNRRFDIDITVQALALTAEEMHSKSKQTGEVPLAVPPVLG